MVFAQTYCHGKESVGSLHMQHNCTATEYDVTVQEFLHCLPKQKDAVILLEDFNVSFQWALV